MISWNTMGKIYLEEWCKLNNPKLIEEFSRKNERMINDYTYASNDYALWECSECGFEWKSKIGNRTLLKRGCPKCGRKKTAEGVRKAKAKKNNLSEQFPQLAAEWDYEKNYPLKPADISSGSEEKVFWICPWCGTNYEMRINKRTRRNSSCPRCAKQSTSFPEQAIYYYLNKVFPKATNRDSTLGFEVDIFIPELNIAVEYDGIRWHSTEASLKKDNVKDDKCVGKGIKLIRFRDSRLTKTSHADIINCKDGDNADLEKGLLTLFNMIGCEPPSIDLKRDTINIIASYSRMRKEKSLSALFPEIAAEWDYEKNTNLSPDMVPYGYGKKVWWRCSKCGNSFSATPNGRTCSKSGCPRCSIKRRSEGNQVKIINLDTGIIYESLSEAAESCNGRKSDICTCCNGGQKSAFGYRWAYVDESKRRQKHYSGKVRCVETGEIFENDKAAARWCGGDNRNINSVIAGRNKTYKGYHWEQVE